MMIVTSRQPSIVPYKIARPAIRSGDLICFTHRIAPWNSWYDFQLWGIRLGQLSEYTHVGIAIVEDGRVKLVESVEPKPRIAFLSDWLPAFHIQMGLDWTVELDEYAKHFAYDDKYRYSKWDAILSPFGLNDRENCKIECAELCNLVYKKAGILVVWRDTPADTVRGCQKRGGGVVLIEDV